jgi:hypothetical protein
MLQEMKPVLLLGLFVGACQHASGAFEQNLTGPNKCWAYYPQRNPPPRTPRADELCTVFDHSHRYQTYMLQGKERHILPAIEGSPSYTGEWAFNNQDSAFTPFYRRFKMVRYTRDTIVLATQTGQHEWLIRRD